MKDHSAGVPEGLKFAPAHFLSAPTNEELRKFIEGDNHRHFIIKIDKKHGKYEVSTFGSFTTVTDRFCFETSEIRDLCYLTTGYFGIWKSPNCKHGARTALAVKSYGENCPRENGSLELRLLCTGKVDDFQAENGKRVKMLKQEFYTLDLASTYKIKTDPGDPRGTEFSFIDLCRTDGIKKLGDFPSKFKAEEKNCKNSQKVTFELWQQKKELLKFGKVYGPIYGDIKPCSHDYECKNANISVPLTRDNPSPGNTPASTKTSNSTSDPPATVVTNVNNYGYVQNLGGIGGKDNKNEINDQSMEDSRRKQRRRRAPQKKENIITATTC